MNKLSKNARYDFIDLLKGCGIFLVVWGHTMNPRSVYLYSFHMPLFFFLSGYVHKDKPFRDFWTAKIKSLYIPYVIFSLVSWVYYLARHLWYERYSRIESHIMKLSTLFTGNADNGGNNPIWFLTCILVVSLVFLLLHQKVKNRVVFYFIILGMSFIGYGLSIIRFKLFFYADVAFSGIVFYSLGYMVKQKNYLDYVCRLNLNPASNLKTIKISHALARALPDSADEPDPANFSSIFKKNFNVLAGSRLKQWVFYTGILFLELLHIGTAYLNPYVAQIRGVNMAGNLLGNYFLFYLSAIFGITVFLLLGYKIQSFKAINYLGMNTLIVLALHKPLLQILNGFFQEYLDTNSLVYGFCASIFVILLLLTGAGILKGSIPQALRKKPLFR